MSLIYISNDSGRRFVKGFTYLQLLKYYSQIHDHHKLLTELLLTEKR